MPDRHLRPRARRYPIVTTLCFRQREDEAWRSAWTLDLSRTGVLFSHEGPAPESMAPIEFVLALPIFAGAPGTQVRCSGQVRRVEPAGSRHETWAVAATIGNYEFLARLQS